MDDLDAILPQDLRYRIADANHIILLVQRPGVDQGIIALVCLLGVSFRRVGVDDQHLGCVLRQTQLQRLLQQRRLVHRIAARTGDADLIGLLGGKLQRCRTGLYLCRLIRRLGRRCCVLLRFRRRVRLWLIWCLYGWQGRLFLRSIRQLPVAPRLPVQHQASQRR